MVPGDILAGINMLLAQIASGRPEVQDEYSRAVPEGGNPAAIKLMGEVFTRSDASWRAIGTVKNSGLSLAPEGGQHQSINTPLLGMSSDRLANSGLRVQATCMATGQAAGTSAALAARPVQAAGPRPGFQ